MPFDDAFSIHVPSFTAQFLVALLPSNSLWGDQVTNHEVLPEKHAKVFKKTDGRIIRSKSLLASQTMASSSTKRLLMKPDARWKTNVISKEPSETVKCVKLLVAGTISAIVARTCVAPLERVKVEVQIRANRSSTRAVAAQIWRSEGFRGFWRGNGLNLIRTAPFKALNFMCFDVFHHALVAMTGKDANMERFLAGALSGCTATLVCFPLDVVRTRIIARGGKGGPGPFKTLVSMVQHEGFRSLYSGCLPAIMGMACAGAVFYGVYDMLKASHIAHHALTHPESSAHSLDAVHSLMFGALAGGASECVVYPMEVLRRRMQLQSMAAALARRSPIVAEATALTLEAIQGATVYGTLGRVGHAMEEIVRREGVRGFYTGLLPNLMQVLPSGALSYYTYDTMKSVLAVID